MERSAIRDGDGDDHLDNTNFAERAD